MNLHRNRFHVLFAASRRRHVIGRNEEDVINRSSKAFEVRQEVMRVSVVT